MAIEPAAALEVNPGLSHEKFAITAARASATWRRDKACNQSTLRPVWDHPKSKGIVGRFNGSVRDVTDNDDGGRGIR